MSRMNFAEDDDVVDEMISMFDSDGSGKIEFEEFVDIVQQLGFTVDKDQDSNTEDQEGKQEANQAAPQQIAHLEEEKKEDIDAVGDQDEASSLKINELPPAVQSILKSFDFDGSGAVKKADLERAAELLAIEKMKGTKDPEANPALHWKKGREKRGLGGLVYKSNHIAIIVSDVGRIINGSSSSASGSAINPPSPAVSR